MLSNQVMNEKLHQCVGLVELLRDHLKDKHHTRLELMIIVLIMIEVCRCMFLFCIKPVVILLTEYYGTRGKRFSVPSLLVK